LLTGTKPTYDEIKNNTKKVFVGWKHLHNAVDDAKKRRQEKSKQLKYKLCVICLQKGIVCIFAN
jgi:hypothetical protein